MPSLRDAQEAGRIAADDPDLPIALLAEFLYFELSEYPPKALRVAVVKWRAAQRNDERKASLDFGWRIELAEDEELRRAVFEALPERHHVECLEIAAIRSRPLETRYLIPEGSWQCAMCETIFDIGKAKAVSLVDLDGRFLKRGGGVTLCSARITTLAERVAAEL